MKQNEIEQLQELQSICLPRWDELPDIELYMDQLVTLVERYVAPFKVNASTKLISSSMVHNYVKHQLILAPTKKRYDQRHLARLIIITILKQSFDLPIIQKGIEAQIERSDYRQAYDQFCSQLEDSIKTLSQDETAITIHQTHEKYQAVQMATLALAAKLITEKTL